MTNLKLIKQLREQTNVGLNDCKLALQEANGSLEEAVLILKKKGTLKTEKLERSPSKEGCIYSYVHHDKKSAAMIEVNCQTDFAALTPEFTEFCEAVALQIVSMQPLWLSSGDIPEDKLNSQREVFQAQNNSIPESKREHVVNNKLKKWFSEVCLMDQKSVVSSNKTIEQLREELVQKIQENVVVKRFAYWRLGS